MPAFSSILGFLAVISASQALVVKNEHSLHPPYEAGNPALLTWDLTGSAELHGTHIRLTPDEEHRDGAIWNNFPCFSNNWEIQVQYKIHGKGVYLFGDGIAIWYVKESDMLHSGPVFGSKDYFTGLGVFIDTRADEEKSRTHNHPYISAVVNNGTMPYDHDESGTWGQIGGCHVPIRNPEASTRIAISYSKNILAVYVDNEGFGQWKICLRSEGVHLPTGNYFGISASTSDASDNHDILGVTSLSMDTDDAEWQDKSDLVPRAENILVPFKTHKDEDHEDDEEELQKVDKKREIRQEDGDSGEKGSETAGSGDEESSAPTSLIRKLVYISGAAAILMVSISLYKKYKERRRVQIEKRLF